MGHRRTACADAPASRSLRHRSPSSQRMRYQYPLPRRFEKEIRMPSLDTIRTDVVGSLLRPEAVREARLHFDEGEIDVQALARIEDIAVREAIALQEAI